MNCHRIIELQNLGLSLMHQGKLIEAVKIFEEIMTINPTWEHGLIAYSLAGCYEELNRLEDAERMSLYALEQEPGNSYYLSGYASFLYLYGEPSQALHYFFKYLKSVNYRQKIVEKCMPVLLELGQRLGFSKSDISKMLDEYRISGETHEDFTFLDK